MKDLSDENLIESYERAKSLELEPDFIKILYKELERRNLTNMISSQ